MARVERERRRRKVLFDQQRASGIAEKQAMQEVLLTKLLSDVCVCV